MLQHLLRRSWLVLLLGTIAGVTAWFTLRGTPTVYEASLTYVLRPAATLSANQVADAVRNLSSDSGQLRTTIASVISSDRFLQLASQRATGRTVGSDYQLRFAPTSDADILGMVVRGPDRQTVEEIAGAFSGVANGWVHDAYRVYQLDLLTTKLPEGPVPKRSFPVIALSTILGALLGVAVAYAEWKAREFRERGVSPVTAQTSPSPPDLSARLDRLEESLRRLEPSSEGKPEAAGRLRVRPQRQRLGVAPQGEGTPEERP